MTADRNNESILRRLRELEQENARLRQSRAGAGKRELIVTEGEYKGHPILTFEGSVHRFTLGLTKLRAIREAWPQVEAFLNRHGDTKADEDDPRI